MMVIIKARPGTMAPSAKRVGIELPASVTSQTVFGAFGQRDGHWPPTRQRGAV